MPQALGFAIAGVFGATTIGVGTATVIGSVALGVVSIGGQMIIGKFMKQPSLKPSDAQTEVRLTIAPRRRSYGRVRVSGTLWFLDTPASGNTDRLYTGLVINHGRISRIVSFHIDENEVIVDGGTGAIVSSPYNFDASNQLLYRLGEATENAYTDLDTIFGIPNMRGDGCATILARMRDQSNAELHMTTFPGGGFPEYRVTMDATVCFDPRDPVQDIDTEYTWDYTENPIVVLLNYLIDPDGFGISYDRIAPNLDQWLEAIHACERQISLLNGGMTDLYRIAATFELTDRPVDVVARILAVCDGRLWQRRDGSLGISIGVFEPPGVTITDDHIAAWRVERGQDPLSAIAGLRGSYMSPDHDYREHEVEPWPDGVTVAALTEDRVTQLDLTWVPSRSQARRLMKREYARQTSPWRLQITTNLYGLRAMDARFIQVQIAELGLDESFEVQNFTIEPEKLLCHFELLAVDATIDDWDPSEEGTETEFADFAFVSSFSKTGTALNPLTEAGALVGQTVLVFGAASTLASTPAGYTLVTSAGPTSGLAIGAYSRVIDGSEGSATFLGASGALIACVMKGAYSPVFSDADQQVTAGDPTNFTKNITGPPYGIFAFAACLANKADTTWLSIEGQDDEEKLHSTGASLSGLLKLLVYSAEETPGNITVVMGDEGASNGILSFVMEPGG